MTQWESWSMAFDDRQPIYRQIVLQFYRAFARGSISPGERIPSIREMSATLKVNTNTMQRVYQEMERDSLISSRRGTGYFFTEETNMIDQTKYNLARESLQRFVEEMRLLGCEDGEIVDELKSYMNGEKTDAADS